MGFSHSGQRTTLSVRRTVLKRLPFVSAAFVIAASLSADDVRAQVCPAPEGGPKVAQIDAHERLDFLARAFDREIYDVDVWSWTWGSVYTAGVVAEGVALSLTHDPGARTDLTVGILATGFGALSLYGLPLKLTLPLRVSRSHWEDDADRCADLARAERALVSVENDQSFATGIFAHVGNVAVNTAIVLILGLGYHHWASAALSGGIGVAVGETNLLTQPHHLRDVLARYRSGRLDAPGAKVAWSIAPVLTPQTSGVTFAIAW